MESAKWASIILEGQHILRIRYSTMFFFREQNARGGVESDVSSSRSPHRLLPQRMWNGLETSKRPVERGGCEASPRSGPEASGSFRDSTGQATSFAGAGEPQGREHLPHAAEKLSCSVRTIQRHTKGNVTWRKPPLHDARGDTPDVHQKRLRFADKQVNATGQMSRAMANCTHLDHKQVHGLGLNRSHQL